MKLLESLATAFWGLALCLGIILALSLFLGIVTGAKYNQDKRRAKEQGGGDPWAL